MTLSGDQSVPDKGDSPSNLKSMSHAETMNTTTGKLPRGPSVALGPSVSAFRMKSAANTALPGSPVQSSSSSNIYCQLLDTELRPDEPELATVKHDMNSDEEEDVKPPQTKRRCEWHPPLLAPSPDRNTRARQRAILPSPPRHVRSRSPRARAIYDAYRPGLRLASVVDQNATDDNAYENYARATRNVHIARIERLRAREELENAIFELDLFQLELARERWEEHL